MPRQQCSNDAPENPQQKSDTPSDTTTAKVVRDGRSYEEITDRPTITRSNGKRRAQHAFDTATDARQSMGAPSRSCHQLSIHGIDIYRASAAASTLQS